MLKNPLMFQSMLDYHGLINDMYSAMSKDDTSEMVMTALAILKKTKTIPPLIKISKCEVSSTEHRNEGNKAFREEKYQKSIECFNKAILNAPKNSKALKLAYGNRSAVLLKAKAFSACLRDIETCFSLGCPDEILEKLKKRREEARKFLWMEDLSNGARYSTFTNEFFQLNLKRNPDIPCASTDVGVVMENQVPKVVAATDIKVGTVLAVETAFVSQTPDINLYTSCYHCQKFTYNLIPCHNCCFALFCNEECMEASTKEYHGVECHFIENIGMITSTPMSILAIKAVLKIRNMCKNWKELVAASYDFGIERMKNSSINDIFDVKKKFSILNFKNDKHFVYGAMYNSCFGCAVFVHYLDSIQSFFPESPDEKNEAMRAISRMMMFLTLYGTNTELTPSVTVAFPDYIGFHNNPGFGWFSFVGKLRNSCKPNMIVANLNKSVALIALQPIQSGTELTISYMGHYLDDGNPAHNILNKFIAYGIVCKCVVCRGEWMKNNKYQLTDVQKKNLSELNLEEIQERFNPKIIAEIYPKLCKSLAFLNGLPYSKEYEDVYDMFKKCIQCLQHYQTNNVIIDDISP